MSTNVHAVDAIIENSKYVKETTARSVIVNQPQAPNGSSPQRENPAPGGGFSWLKNNIYVCLYN